MSLKRFALDPGARKDFAVDWTRWLSLGELITTTVVTAESGVTVDDFSEADGIVTVWLQDGVLNKTPAVTCRVTTDSGRTDERSFVVVIEDL